MSNLRSKIIRLAASFPEGSEERRVLLSAMKQASSKVAHPLDRMRGHMLLPANIRSKIPKIGGQEEMEDPIVYAKFFSPYGNGQSVWLITEFDGHDELFGWADLGMGGGELGYMSLSELEGVTTKLGIPAVERDQHFHPMPLSQAKRA